MKPAYAEAAQKLAEDDVSICFTTINFLTPPLMVVMMY
jgi:hypothetical protein